MNVKISVFVICIETIIYLLLYNLHDCTFKLSNQNQAKTFKVNMICKVKITYKVIDLERVPDNCIINKELKKINLFKFM